MERKQQVFFKLKPKVKAFGFNRKELTGIAAQIADNLASAEDASDEDVNAEIDERIEAVLPFLQVGQSYANRLAEDARKKNDDDEPDDDDDDTPDDKKGKRQPGSKTSHNTPPEKDDDDTPAWAKGMLDTINALKGEITTLKGEKVANTRKTKLETLLKDSGAYGNRVLKSFDRMKFDTEDEFDEFYSEVEEDLKAYNQERAESGLAALGNPPAAGSQGTGKQDEPFSDKEIEDMANSF